MEFNGSVSGVCYLDNPLAGGVFGDEEFKLVTLLLANASIAVENTLLHLRIEKNSAAAPRHNNAVLDENLRRVVAYLEEHFSEDISRGDLAEIIGVHPDYLGKLFKVRTGRTIREYVNDLKIRAAMDRLDRTNDKIITIAFDIGFESLRTFNRIFSRAAGMTPAEYRERNRKA
jgi:transcriptional regulator GlxA family with amidase domain